MSFFKDPFQGLLVLVGFDNAAEPVSGGLRFQVDATPH
jgi:hypothetical protein